ncbi:hypothetical protein V6U77_23945, partial [Micromonospora sp. CPCC 205546]
MPSSGNAPPVPGAPAAPPGAGVQPPHDSGPRSRPAAPDDVEVTGRRRRVAGDDETAGRTGRPERPADWLRQAGRAHHTDPALPTVKRSVPPVPGGPSPVPPGLEQRGAETGNIPTGPARPGTRPPRPTDATEPGRSAGRVRPVTEPPRPADTPHAGPPARGAARPTPAGPPPTGAETPAGR